MSDSRELAELCANIALLNQEYEAKKGFLAALDVAIDLSEQAAGLRIEIGALNSEYEEKKRFLQELTSQYSALEDAVHWRNAGIYEPQFSYETTEQYKDALRQIIQQQKQMIKDKQAVICSTVWRVNDSVREGRLATDLSIRFTLRAFNNECEAILGRLRTSNYKACASAINKAFFDINRLKKPEFISVSEPYLSLKLSQLRILHEQVLKIQEEKDDARRTREHERERLRAEKELEEALKQSEIDQERYRFALEQARQELGLHDSECLKEQVAELERKLAIVSEQRRRALSMAQLTRSGYVYVISNVGSFGEMMFKIGMTRRLEPMDRIRELGDASVPFSFDVHAIIWTTDAPALEGELHRKLHAHRVNKVNFRKEFFSANMKTVREVVLECVPDAAFDEQVETPQYWATVRVFDGPKAAKNVA